MIGNPMEEAERIHPTLPIFLVNAGERPVIYTPGHLAVIGHRDAHMLRRAWGNGEPPPDNSVAFAVVPWIEMRSCEAWSEWERLLNEPFAPECLTIYPGNQCNLACPYCYAGGAAGRQAGRTIAPAAVESAARLVARNCADKRKAFQLVLHGGGEPTLHWDLVERIVLITRRVADEIGAEWLGYIATNGVLSETRAIWLARNFTVGLSCDGPPEIQDRQRPLADGSPSSGVVERTARLVVDTGGRLEVRATITPAAIPRQREIVEYLHHKLGTRHMHFEPLYRAWTAGSDGAFSLDDVEPFAEHFRAAQDAAKSLGAELFLSGVRVHEIHGPYCDLIRQVLRLTPDGTATACFLDTGGDAGPERACRIGAMDESTGEFLLDRERIALHRMAVGRIPPGCHGCPNVFHCARDCPETCYARAQDELGSAAGDAPGGRRGVRCRIAQRLFLSWIRDAAFGTRASSTAESRARFSTHGWTTLLSQLQRAAPRIDADAIARQWSALGRGYRVGERRPPMPIWAKRGFEDGGPEAWRKLDAQNSNATETAPLSIYVHIPFCDRRCGYCDCRSVLMPRRNRIEESSYCRVLLEEIEAWSKNEHLSRRPVTTVHFGGGTPNYLGFDLFDRIVDELRRRFNTVRETEWALETTGSLLTRAHLAQLKDAGFTRLHVGVQTLEDGLRRAIGRRQSGAGILEGIALAIEMGFVSSVDVIYGLPGQELPGFLDSLVRLAESGAQGFSLYRLNVSARNLRFIQKRMTRGRDPLHDYALLQAGEQLLRASGYRKNHFTHYALAADRNLYFTHPQRGEDLLALGASADGFFGHYHYRHMDYSGYVGPGAGVFCSLQGGLPETEREKRIRPVTASLMGAGIKADLLRRFGLQDLLEEWKESALLEPGSDPGTFALTANGSWFIDRMIDDAESVPVSGG